MASRNGTAAVVTLTYLGFALQLVQVGLLPLLPTIGHQLHASPTATSWILTSGLLSGAVFLAVLTRLADLIGKRPVILLAMALVLVGAVLDSVADSLPLILIGRVLIGAQLPMLALPEAIASDTMPPDRARLAVGSIHMGTGVGIAGGLIVGALVGIHPANWHLYFVIGAIAAFIGLVATAIFVQDSTARAGGGLDPAGAILLTLALVGLLLGLSEGPVWGWGSARVLGALVGGVVLGVVWWWVEGKVRFPLIDLAYLRRRAVALPYAMTFLVAFGIYGSLSAVTRLAQTPVASGYGYGWSSLTVAWFALPQAVGSILGIVVLRAMRPRGLVLTTITGCALITLGFVGFAAGHAVPVVEVASLGLDSMGLAISIAATQLLVLAAITPAESGIGLGLSVVQYAVGNAVGSAVFSVFFVSISTPSGQPTLNAYLTGFAVCGLFAVVALLLCIPLRPRLRT